MKGRKCKINHLNVSVNTKKLASKEKTKELQSIAIKGTFSNIFTYLDTKEHIEQMLRKSNFSTHATFINILGQ
jgi:hypothetical protein